MNMQQFRARIAPARPSAVSSTFPRRTALSLTVQALCSPVAAVCGSPTHCVLLDTLRVLVNAGCGNEAEGVCMYNDGTRCTPLHAAAVAGNLCALRVLTRTDSPSVYAAVLSVPVPLPQSHSRGSPKTGLAQNGQTAHVPPKAWTRAVAGLTGLLPVEAWGGVIHPDTPLPPSVVDHDGRGRRFDRYSSPAACRGALGAMDGAGRTPAQAANAALQSGSTNSQGMRACLDLILHLQALCRAAVSDVHGLGPEAAAHGAEAGLAWSKGQGAMHGDTSSEDGSQEEHDEGHAGLEGVSVRVEQEA